MNRVQVDGQAKMRGELLQIVASLLIAFIVLIPARLTGVEAFMPSNYYGDEIDNHGLDYDDSKSDRSDMLSGGPIELEPGGDRNSDDQDYGPMDPAELAIDYESNRFPGDTVSVEEIESAIVPCPDQSDISCKFREACGLAPLNKLTPPGDKARIAPYIINGETQTPGEWPSFVRLFRIIHYPDPNAVGYREFRCGGTLVSDRHVLTAAHCTSWMPVAVSANHRRYIGPNDAGASLGEHDTNWEDDWQQLIKVKSMCISRKYNSSGTVNDDWALLELDRPVQFNKYIQPACLPFEPVVRTGNAAQCYTVGLGQLRNEKLQLYWNWYVQKMRIEQVTCKAYGLSDRDRSRECYAKARRHQGTSCYGDSGGPALCLNERGRWTVVGVTSYADDEPGQNCSGNGPKAWKTVFARVRTLLSDIKEQCHF